MTGKSFVYTSTLLSLFIGAVLTIPSSETFAASSDPTQDQLMITAGFLNGHPDLRFRLLGLEKHRAGELEKAFRYFQFASFYGDKPSQGMVAEMLWTGVGTTQNRPLGYAWMDLAAERGYEGFAGLRERYWNDLSEDERIRAVGLGQDVYARYSDGAALPRIATKLRRERRGLTGSRTGFAGNVRIVVPTASGTTEIDGSKFYDERYWDPDKYQAWQDSVWMKPRIGTVNVGDAQQLPTEAGPRRIPDVAPLLDIPEPDLGTEMPSLQSDNKNP